MKIWGKRVGFGVILWAVCYVIAIPLLPVNAYDPQIFRSLMFALSSITASVIAVVYFSGVHEKFLREAVLLGLTWVVVNWVLDVVALLPFTHQTIPQYFMQLGIEYIGMIAPIIAIGFLLQKKTATTS